MYIVGDFIFDCFLWENPLKGTGLDHPRLRGNLTETWGVVCEREGVVATRTRTGRHRNA